MSGFYDDKFFRDTRRREMEIQRDKENQARFAAASAHIASVGVGSYEIPDPITFGTTFVSMPLVSHSGVLDRESLVNAMLEAHLMKDTNKAVPLPHISGYVVDWDYDGQGNYIGCWVAVAVSFPGYLEVPNAMTVNVDHHFRFEGVGLKQLSVSTD